MAVRQIPVQLSGQCDPNDPESLALPAASDVVVLSKNEAGADMPTVGACACGRIRRPTFGSVTGKGLSHAALPPPMVDRSGRTTPRQHPVMKGQGSHKRSSRSRETVQTCEAAALAYRSLGWSVIPLKSGEKVPKLPWQEFQDRRADDEEIRAWFKRWPRANLGVVTGPVSGLVVLDVDPRHGGEESLRHWTERHGRLPKTPEAETGGGGRHLYFATRDPELGNRVAIAPGIDLRGRGGMIVAPPSIHPSGRPYVWKPGHAPADLPPAPLPQWLHERLSAEMSGRGHPLAYWRSLVRSGVEQGQRNNTIASFAGHLLWHGVEPEVVLELLLSWNRTRCRPPLNEDEVARVVASITKLHQREGPGGEA